MAIRLGGAKMNIELIVIGTLIFMIIVFCLTYKHENIQIDDVAELEQIEDNIVLATKLFKEDIIYTCKYCNTPLGKKTKFCPYCGADSKNEWPSGGVRLNPLDLRQPDKVNNSAN